ncbi:MAG: response regulator [Chloroflexota bacterium]
MSATIMVADDDEGIRRVMEATLRDDPRYRVVAASDGAEALDVARREKPNLAFLDVRMPRMSGLEVCRALKSDPATRHISVVMVSALGTDSDRRRAVEAGADDYFVKPFSPTDLLGKVEEVLSRPQSKVGSPALGELPPREQEVPTFEQMGREQLEVYAQELGHLFREERRLRSEMDEKNRQLEQRIKEIHGLNQMVQAHLAEEGQVLGAYRELFLEWKRLMNEMQALAARGDSLPLPESLDDAGATARDEGQ